MEIPEIAAQFVTVEKSEYDRLLAIKNNAEELLELNKIGLTAFDENPVLRYTQKSMWNDLDWTHKLLTKILTIK